MAAVVVTVRLTSAMPTFLRTLRYLWRHPLNAHRRAWAVARWMRFQIARRTAPGSFLVDFVGDARLIVEGGDHTSLVVYTGLFDYEEMLLTAHLLREEETFVDVGAHVGVYSVLAAKIARARCIAFEPVPRTYQRLLEHVALNGLAGLVDARRAAVGDRAGEVYVADRRGAENRIVDPAETRDSATPASLVRLDEALGSATPVLVKIDVEGYEAAVLEGMGALLEAPSLLGLVLEMAGHGRSYGFDEDELEAQLRQVGLTRCRYVPDRRLLIADEEPSMGGNAIYLRRDGRVEARLENAPAVYVPHAGRRI